MNLPERYRVISLHPDEEELRAYLFDNREDIFDLELAKIKADSKFEETGVPHLVWQLHTKLAVIIYRAE